jgi:hypothetical protein
MRAHPWTLAGLVLLEGLLLATRARAQDPPLAGAGAAPAQPPPPLEALLYPTVRSRPTLVVDAEETAPPGYHSATRARSGLVTAGVTLFGVTYGSSLLATALDATLCATACASVGHDEALAVPGIGPFVQMARTTNPAGNAILALDGLAQLGGIAMFTVGLAMRQEVFVPDRAVETPRLVVTPVAGSGGAGFLLGGRF